MNNLDGSPIQTIRISDKEKDKLVWAVNNAPELNIGVDPSRLRVTPAHTDAVLSLIEKGSKPVDFAVIAYSYGRQSISLIHGRYIHPGTACRVRFKALSGEWHERSCDTGPCAHVKGMIHVVMIGFDEPINLDEFAQLTSDEETRHLKEISEELPDCDDEESGGLVSRVLYVDDQPSDRKLVNYWLNRAGMQVSTVANCESTKTRIADNDYDLLIVDLLLGEERGADLIKDVRRDRFVQPILAVSADETESLRESALQAGANAFLAKPFSEKELLAAARALLGFDEDEEVGPIYSDFNDDKEMLPLLTGYVRSLPTVIDKLRTANGNNDYDTILYLASSLKGCGSGYGFPDVTSKATGVLNALDADIPDMDEIKRLSNALASTLSRIKVRHLAADPEG